MAAPAVHDYLDFRAFLRDWLEERQQRDPGFSRRKFVRLAGRSSPGLFAEVVEGGRRILPETSRAFAKAMRLNRVDADFFDTLVRFGQAEDPVERRAAWAHLLGSQRFRTSRRAVHQSLVYRSCWWIPVVRELAARADFDPEPWWIASRVRPPITGSQARLALEALLDLGMLVPDARGVPRPADGALATPAEAEAMAIHAHHEGIVELMSEAIDHLPLHERQLLGATLSVPTHLVAVLEAELHAFRERLVALCATVGEPRDQVVQLQLALFPVTDRSSPGEAP